MSDNVFLMRSDKMPLNKIENALISIPSTLSKKLLIIYGFIKVILRIDPFC